MSLVKAMLAQGATIPEVSAVVNAADVLAAQDSFTLEEVQDAEQLLDEAAERWLGINLNDEEI